VFDVKRKMKEQKDAEQSKSSEKKAPMPSLTSGNIDMSKYSTVRQE